MAKAKVKLYHVKEITGVKKMIAEASNISDLLSSLIIQLGWRFEKALYDRETGTINLIIAFS
jgi:hypothetical protein